MTLARSKLSVSCTALVLLSLVSCVVSEQHRSDRFAATASNGTLQLAERRHRKSQQHRHHDEDLSLWIDQQQVKMFAGFPMEIYAIADGRVLSYILDPNFENYLPVIPSEVTYVNFTWKSGENKKYYYHFDRLQSFNEDVLHSPTVSLERRGRIPRKPKVFSVYLPCSGNASGIASFTVGLIIESHRGKPLAGTPLRLRLRKECTERLSGDQIFSTHAVSSTSSSTASAGDSRLSGFPHPYHGPDPECDKTCANGGWCNYDKICQCLEGYMGQQCTVALCYPKCMNGGICSSPGVCSCPSGFQGRHCEGGICKEKCLNGGKCIQKDTCQCPRGFYGLRCELSKCVIPCLNGGRCRGVNQCRCLPGFKGDHCEVTSPGRLARLRTAHLCNPPCRHGICAGINSCLCHEGFSGKICHKHRQYHNATDGTSLPRRRRVWVK